MKKPNKKPKLKTNKNNSAPPQSKKVEMPPNYSKDSIGHKIYQYVMKDSLQ